MNIDRILAELRLEREVVTKRVAELREAITMFERLQGSTTTATVRPPAKRPGRRPRGDVDWAQARQQYENAGTAVAQIAKVFHVHPSAVYVKIKAEGWKRAAA